MTEPHDSWERLPAETPVAYAAFQLYLRAGAARSVTRVATECNKSRSLLNRWSARHKWVRRAAAWDADLNAQYRGELVEAQRTLAHRHITISQEALSKVALAVTSIDAAALTVGEAVKLWDIASRTERELIHLSARLDAPRGESEALHISRMTDEERLARLKMVRRELDERIGAREGDVDGRGASSEDDTAADE